jgi:hypothetical protein
MSKLYFKRGKKEETDTNGQTYQKLYVIYKQPQSGLLSACLDSPWLASRALAFSSGASVRKRQEEGETEFFEVPTSPDRLKERKEEEGVRLSTERRMSERARE